MAYARLRLALLLALFEAPAGAEVDYRRDIQPLLAAKCVSCHGPVKQEAGLRLDAGVLVRQGSDNGIVAESESPDDSLLLRRVTTDVPDERMPPASEGEPLTAEHVAVLRQWIAAGLPSPADEPVLASVLDHWAYRPIVRPEVPRGTGPRAEASTPQSRDRQGASAPATPFSTSATSGTSLPTSNDHGASTVALPDGRGSDGTHSEHPLDRLLAAHHHAHALTPLPPADPATLLRRVTFDLIGLPPTLEEQDRFLADSSPEAYARLVEELLARPQHGERWARHWMDVWRYSDWDGYKEELRGSQRHIWQWRDWIVESLNADKPYDRMVTEMLAGDELAPADRDVLRATGFLARNHHASNRNIWLDAAVEHTAKAFLGMTLNCARCHDHKYDPLEIRDYYAFRAIFEPYKVRTDRLPGEADLKKSGLPRVYDADLDAATYVYLQGDEKRPDKEHPVSPAAPELFGLPFAIEPVPLPPMASFPSLAEYIEREELAAATARRDALASGGRQPADSATEAGSGTAGSTMARRVGRPPAPASAVALDVQQERARRELTAAELELAALQARWAADRRKHSDHGPEPTGADAEALASAAARAERSHAVAAAERDVYAALLEVRATYTSSEGDAAKRNESRKKADERLAKADEALLKARENAAKSDATYTSVGPVYPGTSSGRRSALARWIVHPQNPLTARVAVNYVWLHHFGRPLVDNVFDFGLRSPQPPLADVLDWLAAELIDSGWSFKHLHQVIVTSQAYQRASSAETAVLAHNGAVDPDNHWWWRADVRRLEAEVVRDSLLAVSGRLDLTRGGPDIDFRNGEQSPRRSLYFRHAYEKQMPLLTTFDAANPTDCYRRTTSIVPQQALALANSDLSVSTARGFVAAASETEGGMDDDTFIWNAFRRCVGRTPDARESAACVSFLAEQRRLLAEPNRLQAIPGTTQPSISPAADPIRRARENLVHVLLNHNDFVTLR